MERTFAWLAQYRRLNKDYERLNKTSETMILIAMYLAPHKPIWRLGDVLDHIHALMKAPSKAVQGFKGNELKGNTEGKTSKLNKLRERLGLK